MKLGEFFFGRRRTPLKWIAIVPGFIAFIFLGHSFEDPGLLGALPYIVIIGLSVTYLFRPMFIFWIILFGSFAIFAGLIAFGTEEGLLNEGFPFAAVPAILMLFAWPMKLEPPD